MVGLQRAGTGSVQCDLVDGEPPNIYREGGCISGGFLQVEDSVEAVGDHEDGTGHRNEVLG